MAKIVRLTVQLKEGVGSHHVRTVGAKRGGFVTMKGGDIFEIDEARLAGIKDKVIVLEVNGEPVVTKAAPIPKDKETVVAASAERKPKSGKELEEAKVEESAKAEADSNSEKKDEDPEKKVEEGLKLVSLGADKYNIVNPEGKPINDVPLSEDEAKALMHSP